MKTNTVKKRIVTMIIVVSIIIFFAYFLIKDINYKNYQNEITQEAQEYSFESELKKYHSLIKNTSNEYDNNFLIDFNNNLSKKILKINNIKQLVDSGVIYLDDEVNRKKFIREYNLYNNFHIIIDELASKTDNKGYFIVLQKSVNDLLKRNDIKPFKLIKEVENKKIKITFLTFDDGPSANTKKIVDMLNDKNVKGTFFFVGNRLNKNAQYVKYAIAHEQAIGLHSYTHVYDNLVKSRKLKKEFIKGRNLLSDKFNVKTNLIRIPYGSTILKQKQKKLLNKNGFYIIDWNVDSLDWKHKKNSKKVSKTLNRQLKNNKNDNLIFLFHEYSSSIKACSKVIDYLNKNDYYIVTMSQGAFYNQTFQ